MRILKTKTFHRWAMKAGVSDAALSGAADLMVSGLVDADLGGNLYKQRVALPGRGKSCGARTLVATRFAGRLVFLFGFEKNERANISARELALYQGLARELLNLSEELIELALARGALLEVAHEPNDG